MKSSQWWPVSGEGRNPFCEKYEESVLEWVYDRRTKGLTEAVAQRRPATLLQKRFWHRRFPANFEKFLKTSVLTEHLRWLFLDLEFHEK